MRRIFFLFIMATGSLAAQTLDDYIRIAAENNPGIRARQTEVEAALQRAPQARALPDPTVEASFFLNPMMLPMGNQLGSVSAMQMFPWPGTRSAMEKEAASMAEVKRQGVVVAQNELAFRVKSAWYPLLALQEQIVIQKDLLRALEADKDLAARMFSQGQAPMADIVRADIMIDEVQTGIALFELRRKPLEFAFNRLLNRADDTPVAVQGRLPAPVGAGRKDDPVAGNPALEVFDKQIEAAVAEEAVAEAMRKPMIGAGIQYMPLVRRGDTGGAHLPPNTGEDMVMPMIALTVPIWKKKYNAAVEERRLMQTAYADRRKDMENELSAMYEMTLYELETMAQTLELLGRQREKTQQAIDLLMASYRNAGREFDEILRLQRQLFGYRMEEISAKMDYQLALAKLDYLTGM